MKAHELFRKLPRALKGLLMKTAEPARSAPAAVEGRPDWEYVPEGWRAQGSDPAIKGWQVESILGPPTTIDTKDFVLLKKTTYIYAQGKESVTIVFKDDKVQSKASTLSE